MATPSIRTTNDMPVRCSVVLPALGLFPVQINPHYIDAHISGHMGETRDERLAEFCAINPSESVVALREGSLLHVEGNELRYFSANGQGLQGVPPRRGDARISGYACAGCAGAVQLRLRATRWRAALTKLQQQP